MTIKLKIYTENIDGFTHQAENHVKSEDISLFLNNMKMRKNISINSVVKKLEYYYLCELFCLYGQLHDDEFIEACDGGNFQSKCRVDWVLNQLNIFR